MFFLLSFLVGCSGEGATWSTPQIHGDERSNMKRYQDCVANSKDKKSESIRTRCSLSARHPEPEYVGVSFPMTL